MHSMTIHQTIFIFKAVTPVETGRVAKVDAIVDGEVTCAIATSGTDSLIGVVVNDCSAGELVNIQVGGLHFNAVMGDAAVPGVFLTAGSDGKLVPAQSGDRSVGVLIGPREPGANIEADTQVVVMVCITVVP